MIGGGAVLAIGWSGDLALIEPGQTKTQDFKWVLAKEGGMLWTDNMAIPKGTPNKQLAQIWINFYYDPKNAAVIEAYVNYVCPVKGAREVMLETRSGAGQQPADLPARGLGGAPPSVPRHDGPGGVPLDQGVHQGRGPLAQRCARRSASGPIAPYALLAPGLIWLAVFFVYPAIQMFLVSLWTGDVQDGFEQTWNWAIYPQAVNEYWPWIARSIVYGGLATILAFALGFPLAYAIAFRGGAYKNLLLFLVIAPFFTSFLLRTLSWKIILSDDGIVLGPLKTIGIIPADFQLLATPGRGHRRHHLQLPAVHDPAAVRRTREDRPTAARGGRGPVRRAMATAWHDRRRDPRWPARRRRRAS